MRGRFESEGVSESAWERATGWGWAKAGRREMNGGMVNEAVAAVGLLCVSSGRGASTA